MAFNKSKFVENAQKLLNQGKVPQAIAEYQQILKFEPKDQVTLMTVGELYIRQGETFQAIEYFERLAQIFVGDGFLTKAIAVYKRIAKLAPEEIKPLERLADLYVQQGVMSEARPLFLQLAEIHLKHNRQTEAVALLKKLLLAEPDNLRIQIRLADLYLAMGKQGDALETYVLAAQRALARGDHAESEKQADKALKLDAANVAALTVKARSASSQGKFAEAAGFLKNLPGLDKGGEQSEFLLDLYIKNGNWDDASALALNVFEDDEKNFGLAQKVAEALIETDHTDRALAFVSKLRIPMLDAGEHEAVTRLLNDLAAKMPGRLEPLEWLVDSYGRTSDSFRLPDALAQLGDALVASKQLQRAKEIFEQLVDRQPESDSAKRKLNDVLRRMGLKAPVEEPIPASENLQAEIPQPDAPKVRPAVSTPPEQRVAAATSTVVDEQPDEETQKFIAQSLTDVDLFASYGLTQKAIGLLEAILRRAPNHTPTLEKLLDFVLGAGDDRRTAELAAQLERIHRERGDAPGAERFEELRRRFQRAAGLSDEEMAAAANPSATKAAADAIAASRTRAGGRGSRTASSSCTEEASIEIIEEEKVAPPQPVQEVDLSDEWASMLDSGSATAPPPAASQVALPVAKEVAPPPPPPPPPPGVAQPQAELPSIDELLPVPTPPPAPAAPQEIEISEFEIPVDEAAVKEPGAASSFAEISAEIPQEISAPAPKAAAPTVAKMAEEILEFVPVEPEPVKAEVPPPPPPPPPPAVAPPRTAKSNRPPRPSRSPRSRKSSSIRNTNWFCRRSPNRKRFRRSFPQLRKKPRLMQHRKRLRRISFLPIWRTKSISSESTS